MRKTGTQPVSGFTGDSALTVSIAGATSVGAVVGDEFIEVAPTEGAVYHLDLDGADGGTFLLGNGDAWTLEINYDVSGATLESGLALLYDLTPGDITAVSSEGIFVITFPDIGYLPGLVADFAELTKSAGEGEGDEPSDATLIEFSPQVGPAALTPPGGAAFARIEARCSLYVEEYVEDDYKALLSQIVRYTLTGGWPDAEKGFDLEHREGVWLSSDYFAGFRAIAGLDNTDSAELYVTYFAAG
jgi:hypothetical protein